MSELCEAKVSDYDSLGLEHGYLFEFCSADASANGIETSLQATLLYCLTRTEREIKSFY